MAMHKDMLQSFVTNQVGIRPDALWLKSLQDLFPGVTADWKKHFHVTLVFVNEISEENHRKLHRELDSLLKDKSFRMRVSSELDLLTTPNDTVIYATVRKEDCPQEFDSLVNDVRRKTAECGGKAEHEDFLFHITLGRLPYESISTEEIKKRLEGFRIPSFEVAIRHFCYKRFH